MRQPNVSRHRATSDLSPRPRIVHRNRRAHQEAQGRELATDLIGRVAPQEVSA